MRQDLSLDAREQRTALALANALSSSLDLRDVLSEAYTLLLRLVPADCGALGVARGNHAEDYDWIVANLPSEFLGRYAEMAPFDFVRESVIARPNVVLRDAEMIDRSALERNMMYHRARELGITIEHVMAVMLHVNAHWQSGLSLYRDKRRPFSARERGILQQLTPTIANAVRNCMRFSEISRCGSLLEALLSRQSAAIVLVDAAFREVGRTDAAAALIARWFPPAARRGGRLPRELFDELARIAHESARGSSAANIWTRSGDSADLRVAFFRLPGRLGEPLWAVELREGQRAAPASSVSLAHLTPRQREIAALLVGSGLSYKQIADKIGVRDATIRTHIEHIYRALNVHSRAELAIRLR
jgi:DNA-binding CsgD family transcriptional regulator/GAF domain-containing protein